MRIVFICKRYYTNKDLLKDRFGRLYHLPKQLVGFGAEAAVLAIDYRNNARAELKENGLTLKTCPAAPITLPTVPVCLYRSAKLFGPDIIVASGDSHIGFLGLLIARRVGAKFVFDVYDYYPAFKGNRIPGFKRMFDATVGWADLVLCASGSLERMLRSSNEKVLRVENGVDTSVFHPMDMDEARRQLCLDTEKLYVGYLGSIESSRGPLLIEASKSLIKEFPNLRLLLAGEVRGVDLPYPWITHLGSRPQSEVPLLINACNVVTIPYASTPFNDFCGACKVAEYLACKRPVVATRVSSHEAIFESTPPSLCDTTPQSMAEAIKLQILKQECVGLSEDFTWNSIGGRLHESLASLTETR